MIGKYFAIVVTVLQIAAGIGFFFNRDWRHGLYWLACATANVATLL